MVKTLLTIAFINSSFFFLSLTGYLSGYIDDSLFFMALYSGGLALLLAPLVYTAYRWGEKSGYEYSRCEIIILIFNKWIAILAILGLFLVLAIGSGWQ